MVPKPAKPSTTILLLRDKITMKFVNIVERTITLLTGASTLLVSLISNNNNLIFMVMLAAATNPPQY